MSIEVVSSKPQAPSKFLIMGEPFSGKTTLAAKAPAPLFMSTDGNAPKMGLDSVVVKTVQDIRETVELAMDSKQYKTLVIDTIEGIVDIFTKNIIEEFNSMGFKAEGKPIQALNDVPFGRATGVLNTRIQNFANTLAGLDQNVIILSYTKQRMDEITGSMVLDSELKQVRLITRFMDAQVLTTYDGEKHTARIVNKREALAGSFEPGEIADFMAAIGWELPKRSTKLKGRGK